MIGGNADGIIRPVVEQCVRTHQFDVRVHLGKLVVDTSFEFRLDDIQVDRLFDDFRIILQVTDKKIDIVQERRDGFP